LPTDTLITMSGNRMIDKLTAECGELPWYDMCTFCSFKQRENWLSQTVLAKDEYSLLQWFSFLYENTAPYKIHFYEYARQHCLICHFWRPCHRFTIHVLPGSGPPLCMFSLLFYHEDRSSMFLQNVSNVAANYTVSHTRQQCLQNSRKLGHTSAIIRPRFLPSAFFLIHYSMTEDIIK
jgi:hypothetical protein